MRRIGKRLLSFLLLLLFAGCSRTTLQTVETVPAANGTDRLIRKEWEITSYTRPNETSYDSHSIVWQRLENGSWVDHLTITQDEFQRGCPNRRWINSIHSFDFDTGVAILKIAEGDVPEGSPTISYIYSWREWDLKSNEEVRTIRVCEDPFDPFD